MIDKDKREPFEAWISRLHGAQYLDRFDDDLLERGGEYEDWSVQMAWEAWQASAEHAKKTMCNRN